MGAKRSGRQPPQQRPVGDLAAILQDLSGASIDEALLRRALTHRSFAYENGGVPHNERQEFLGDAVLGIVVTDTLFHTHPDLPEGQLAKFRAAVVNSRALARVARELGLGDFVLLGRGELTTGGRDKDSILADTTEAVIGAVYLCGGLPAADRLVHHMLDSMLEHAAELGAGLDWKTSLQERAAECDLGVPHYDVTEEGPDHDKVFTARAMVSDTERGRGTGRSKKAAEQRAAEAAWRALKDEAEAATAHAHEPAEPTDPPAGA